MKSVNFCANSCITVLKLVKVIFTPRELPYTIVATITTPKALTRIYETFVQVVSDSIRHLTEAPLSNTHGTAEYTRQVFGAMMLIGAPVLVVYLALWAVLAPQRMDRLGFGLVFALCSGLCLVIARTRYFTSLNISLWASLSRWRPSRWPRRAGRSRLLRHLSGRHHSGRVVERLAAGGHHHGADNYCGLRYGAAAGEWPAPAPVWNAAYGVADQYSADQHHYVVPIRWGCA